jgi:hypothetical protein
LELFCLLVLGYEVLERLYVYVVWRRTHPFSDLKHARMFFHAGLIVLLKLSVYKLWMTSSTLSLHLWGWGIFG